MTEPKKLCKTCLNLRLYFYSKDGDYGFFVREYLDVQAPAMDAISPGLSNFQLYMWLIDQGGCFDCIYEVMKGITDPQMLASANESFGNNPDALQRLNGLRLFIDEKTKPKATPIYDIFISFKNSDANGNRTPDSKIAEQCYRYLTEKGLRVFFSNIELEFIGKAQYTRIIDDALESAKVLIAVGCSYENLNSNWVRYEWESFMNDIRSNIKPHAEVFVLYQGVGVHDLPRALRQQQAFDAGDGLSFERLCNFILNAI